MTQVSMATLGLLLLVLGGIIAIFTRLQALNLSGLERGMREDARIFREEQTKSLESLRAEISRGLKELADGQRSAMEQIRDRLAAEINQMRESTVKTLESNRDALDKRLDAGTQTQSNKLDAFSKRLQEMGEAQRQALETMRNSLELKVTQMREGNEKKLEEMRKTVDEQLQDTLEKRLGESFKLVSQRLEAVQRGLGEMQSLATGVGDLKRVLTNVKTRGTWAEVQLGAILEQMLNPGQFERNVKTKEGSNDLVEFAIRLPGPLDDPGRPVWLPIDAKFPQEDWVRLQQASEAGDVQAVQDASNALVKAVKASAKDIRTKYIDPPSTTDFAILYLATEGLYAEVLRQPGVMEAIQHDERVILAGPTTLAALLSSLRMGFQTLAIERRSAEVWNVLSAVKTEFGKFGAVLEKVKKNLDTASRTIDSTSRRTRVMEQKLKSVEQMEADQAVELLGLDDGENLLAMDEAGEEGEE